LDKASALLGASVTTKRPDLKVRGCAIHLIKSQQDAVEFVQNLTNQTVADQHLDLNFRRHCEEMLSDETMTGDLMGLGSTSTVNQDSCSKSNSNTQPRGELSKLYEVSLCPLIIWYSNTLADQIMLTIFMLYTGKQWT
jgi:hypothetical protein